MAIDNKRRIEVVKIMIEKAERDYIMAESQEMYYQSMILKKIHIKTYQEMLGKVQQTMRMNKEILEYLEKYLKSLEQGDSKDGV